MKGGSVGGLFVREGRLRSGWRMALYLVSYFCGLLIIQVPVVSFYVALLMSRGLASVSALLDAVQPDRLPVWFYLVLKASELLMLLPLTLLFRRLLDRRDWTGLGFRRDPGWPLDLALGFTLGGGQMLLIFGVEWAAGWLSVSVPDSATLAQGMVEGLMAGGLFALVAVGEELLFRGYLQVNLQEGIGRVPALALASLAFSLFHVLNPNLSWLALVNIALAGLAMGYGRVTTGNLWLPIAYHFSWNWFQGAVFSLPVSGVRYGGLLDVADQSAFPLLTGTTFGPEGGVVGTLALLSAFPIFWLWGRLHRTGAGRQKRLSQE